MSIRLALICCSFALAMSLTSPAQEAPRPVILDDNYVLGPDSLPQAGVPQGRVFEIKLPASRIFPGFDHETWLYLPPAYDGKAELPFMVFQDGVRYYLAHDGPFRIPHVLNNLIAKGDIPRMAAIFVEPGSRREFSADGSPLTRESNRSAEYDTPNDAYARFLVDEVLPEMKKHFKLTETPEGHGIAGYSSGGICAFNVAWHRPDLFRKIFTNNGSFVDIRGGQIVVEWIRGAERRSLRVFQQDGSNDVVASYPQLNWPEANKAIAEALTAKGYDHKFVFGEGTHSPKHAASIFPDAMRWLWRDYPRAH